MSDRESESQGSSRHTRSDDDLMGEYFTPDHANDGVEAKSRESDHLPLEVFDIFTVDAAVKSSKKKSIKDAFSRRFAKISDTLEHKDLIEDGNPDELNGLINFQKRELAHMIISEVMQYQQTPYEIAENLGLSYSLVNVLNNLPIPDEDSIHDVSLKLEPRGSQRNGIK